MVQLSVLTLDLSSDLDFRVVSLSPTVGTTLGIEPTFFFFFLKDMLRLKRSKVVSETERSLFTAQK